jgi:hypothetical protein
MHTNTQTVTISAQYTEIIISGIWAKGVHNETQSMLDHETCSEENLDANLFYCLKVVSTISKEQINMTMLPIYYDFYPDGASVKNDVHFQQLVRDAIYFRSELHDYTYVFHMR